MNRRKNPVKLTKVANHLNERGGIPHNAENWLKNQPLKLTKQKNIDPSV